MTNETRTQSPDVPGSVAGAVPSPALSSEQHLHEGADHASGSRSRHGEGTTDHCGIVEVDPADFTRIDARGLAMADARRMWTLAAATLERDIRLHDMTEDEERVMIGAVLSAAERHYEAQSAEIENLKHDVTRQMAIANEYVNEVEAQSATIERMREALTEIAQPVGKSQ